MEVCLFDSTGKRETARIELPEYTDQIFRLPSDVSPGTFYGYRVMDLMRRKMVIASIRTNCSSIPMPGHTPASSIWNPAVFGYQMESGDEITFDERDSAPFVPKCVVVDPDFDWKGEPDGKPSLGSTRSSMRPTSRASPNGIRKCAEKLRGTYAGLGAKEVVELHQVARCHLGRTAADPYVRQRQPPARNGLTNYWGYSTIGFFAPDPRYAPMSPTASANSRRWWPLSRGRPGSNSRRRLQPHRRRQ